MVWREDVCYQVASSYFEFLVDLNVCRCEMDVRISVDCGSGSADVDC